MSRFWSDTVRNILPYVPGEQPQDKKYIKLNTNENPYPPSPKVIEAIRKEIGSDLRLYPDPEASLLKEALAGFTGSNPVKCSSVTVLAKYLPFAFGIFNPGDVITFPDVPTASIRVYAELFGIRYETTALNSDFTVDLGSFPNMLDGILLANPNAPDGYSCRPERD